MFHGSRGTGPTCLGASLEPRRAAFCPPDRHQSATNL
jgi:hypothetical protein